MRGGEAPKRDQAGGALSAMDARYASMSSNRRRSVGWAARSEISSSRASAMVRQGEVEGP